MLLIDEDIESVKIPGACRTTRQWFQGEKNF
jgi:hypothetical protein